MIRHTLILIALIIFLLVYLVFGDYGLVEYFKLVKIKNRYEQQLTRMDKKIYELQRELEFLKKDKKYLEMIIRKELNLKRPNEDLFIIKKDNNEKK
ncbi:septum formation initiator family protein [Deferribacter autotrophicus]|uniref:Septum formation initiator family protein n=1 Tax=Deferribacter autotrophicus TaxID=500465 RepID=A0A5A8F912_9BACT|nr:septum formation initiator family protein [Deferribacter autotrophicus]KAA0259322.1 septum formation initiator family protein [Deferribacter autotrophicus]